VKTRRRQESALSRATGYTVTGVTARLTGYPLGRYVGGGVPVSVPEPETLLLLAVGLAGVVLTHRYRSARIAS